MGKKTKADPTGQARNRRKSARRLSGRLTRAQRGVIALFRAIPRTRREQTPIVNTVVYEYDQNAEQAQTFQANIRALLDAELLETQLDRMPPDWFWKQDIEQPYREGTQEELIQFNQMIAAAAVAGVLVRGMPPQSVPIETVLFSPPYRAALNDAYVQNFATIKTLSDRTADQVIQRINAGIQAGSTPTEIAGEIAERFDVARSSAKRIADTEINKAYNDAKMRAVDIAAEQTGLRAGVLHISALSTTTRSNHAARHGNAYTVPDQLQWWNSGSERINCKCSTRGVLIDSAGNVVQKEAQDSLKNERSFFD